MKSIGEGGGHSLPKQLWISQSQWRRTSAGASLPHSRKKEWKARRASAYESCGNKYKSVSPAVTDMWVSPLPLQLTSSRATSSSVSVHVCVCVHMSGQINRFKKRETVGLTGRDFGLRASFCVESDWEWGQNWRAEEQCVCVCVCVCVYMSVEVSFFMLRLWARLEAATGSNTGWLVFWLSAE